MAITLLIRNKRHEPGTHGKLFYAAVGKDWKKEQKYAQLDSWNPTSKVKWKTLKPDAKHTWLTDGQRSEFDQFILLGDKANKGEEDTEAVFRLFSLGVVSARDAYVFNSNRETLEITAKQSISAYQESLAKFSSSDTKARFKKFISQGGDGSKKERTENFVRAFIDTDDRRIKWSFLTQRHLETYAATKFDKSAVRTSLYRPFFSQWHYFEGFWNERLYQLPRLWSIPTNENVAICANGVGSMKEYHPLAVCQIPCFDLLDKTQCFPFYTYDEDGSNRRENITDWALAEFRKHYADKSISKWDIFHATYAILHHPEYRTRYAANLKRELPRIPFVPEFRKYAKIGEAMMKLHIEYEQQKEYPLQRTEKGPLDWRVEKMRLSKDKTQLTYNDFLTLSGIPSQVYEYRLGNRSALEWVVDQYRVKTDARSGIVNDPNRADDPEYIVRLIGQVVTVSLETVQLVQELAALPLLPN